MYNYSNRQNITPEPNMPQPTTTSPNIIPTAPNTTSTKAPTNMQPPQGTQAPLSPLTQKPPYSQMQDIVTDIVELYHNEIRNMNMYQPLLELAPNMEEEEIIQDIIDHTNNNILYLGQMYLGLTGDTIDKLAMPTEEFPNLSYPELLKNALFSKTDTLDQYEVLYRLIPIQPYKDVLFDIIICQLKDATSINYLISLQTQS